ncbi:hypothetical protein Bca4012_027001 [Brassica carinata]
MAGANMSNLTREVNHTDPTSQIACQQIAEDRTPIAIPPTPVIDVDAALSESEMRINSLVTPFTTEPARLNISATRNLNRKQICKRSLRIKPKQHYTKPRRLDRLPDVGVSSNHSQP